MRAYLDHASTTPLRPSVLEAMLPWMTSADPGRVHTEGRMARVALEEARSEVAAAFGTRSRQVIFTSGATEAIHAAVFGALASAGVDARVNARADGRGDHAVVSEVEHAAVRDATARLAGRVTWVGAGPEGGIRPAEILAAVGPDTALVHAQWANQEVGTLQPVTEIVAACRNQGITVHVDAATAAGRVPIDFDALGADLLSVSAHKLGGPPGIGALLVRRGRRFAPLLVGGSQERARRAGMENVAAAVGFGAAMAALGEPAESGGGPGAPATRLLQEAARARRQITVLRDAALAVDGVSAIGPADPAGAIAHLLCVDVAGVEAEGVLLGLDQAGVAAHSGSSCASELLEPSPVLAAMGLPAERSLRFSVGWTTTDDEVALAARVLPQVIGRLRALAG
ncbi:MAG: cysteine desulfurase [Actinomycetota bacterium]|nr:cysteine desulfurase [Actinomycetota bacterium]